MPIFLVKPGWRSPASGKTDFGGQRTGRPARRTRCDSQWGSTIAQVAELADAHGSGPCGRKAVGVQLSSWAQVLHRNQSDANAETRPPQNVAGKLASGASGRKVVQVFCHRKWCSLLPAPTLFVGVPGTKKRLIIQAFSICPLSGHLSSVAPRSRL